MTHLQEELFKLQDIAYRDFHSSLMPGVDKEAVIGVRIPVLRKFAKEYAKSGETEQFMRELPHIDNWATCDSPLPKCFDKNKEDVLERAKNWIATDATYVKRYGMGVMMRLFLDEDFKEEYIQLVASVKSEEYYVNMMIAWYMATALAKQWDAAIPYIQEHRLSEWVHRKSIQKAVESYRITPEQKEYLKGLR